MWCPCLLCRFLARRRRRAAWLLFVRAVTPAVTPAVTIALVATMAVAAPAAAASHHHERPVFRPPVDAPVADPFRPPENPYGPGNRGIEYDTEPGDVVRAAAGGTVEFAGAVAGHPPRDRQPRRRAVQLRTRTCNASACAPATGVARGAVIGIAGERLHFGVRLDGAYTDPGRTFIGVRRVRVRLVPL